MMPLQFFHISWTVSQTLLIGMSTNQVTLAGLWTHFGVVGPSTIHQLTLAYLYTVFVIEMK